MKAKRWGQFFGIFAVVGVTTVVAAATYNSVQSNFKPMGLTIVDKVQTYGSDATSRSFETVKSTYMTYCNQMLPEGQVFTGAGLYQLDPTRLYFLFDYAPRVYFIKDGACYKNGLGATIATLSAPSTTVLTGNTFTILPNASSPAGMCGAGNSTRTTAEPLLYGDFVQLPTVKAGQQLAFFLMGNLNSSGSTPQSVYYNGSATNADNFQHMIAFFPDNSQYVIIAFEDMYGGGDKDCNDVIFVVDVGPYNSLIWRDPSSLPK